jgi:hypothetical protein
MISAVQRSARSCQAEYLDLVGVGLLSLVVRGNAHIVRKVQASHLSALRAAR